MSKLITLKNMKELTITLTADKEVMAQGTFFCQVFFVAYGIHTLVGACVVVFLSDEVFKCLG